MTQTLKLKWKWAIFALVLAVIATRFLFERERTSEERVAIAIKNLNRQITWRYKVSAEIWEILPDNMQRAFASLTPDYLVELKKDACRELAYFKPDSPEAIDALKRSVNDPFIQEDVFKALQAYGPRAEPALARVLLLLRTRPPPTVITRIYQTITAIAPTDERVVSTLISGLNPTNENGYVAATFLRASNPRYDGALRARVLNALENSGFGVLKGKHAHDRGHFDSSRTGPAQ